MRGEEIDKAIIEAVQINPRLSKKELAAKIGINRNTCIEHVNKLVKKGVLLDYGCYTTDTHTFSIKAIIFIRRPRRDDQNIKLVHELQSSAFSHSYRSVANEKYDYVIMTHHAASENIVEEFVDMITEKLGARTVTYALIGKGRRRGKAKAIEPPAVTESEKLGDDKTQEF